MRRELVKAGEIEAPAFRSITECESKRLFKGYLKWHVYKTWFNDYHTYKLDILIDENITLCLFNEYSYRFSIEDTT